MLINIDAQTFAVNLTRETANSEFELSEHFHRTPRQRFLSISLLDLDLKKIDSIITS